MLSSMTGFGRASNNARSGKLVVEIQSVNRKHLDISLFIPREFSQLELNVRKLIQEHISRGQVIVRINWVPNEESLEKQLPDPKALKVLKARWGKIAKTAGLDVKAIDLPFLLLHMPHSQNVELIDDKDLRALEATVRKAVDDLIQMKQKEGAALVKDLKKRLSVLNSHLELVEKLLPQAIFETRERLQDKMRALVSQTKIDLEDRILREVISYADRLDISEEITRLKSHFAQFKQMLEIKEGVVGRKMDFLIQEMGREVNTIGSKSEEVKIAHLVVEMKSELEKIREQVQNIE